MDLPRFFDVDAAVEYLHGLVRAKMTTFAKQGLADPVDWLGPKIAADMLGLHYVLMPEIRIDGSQKIAGCLLPDENRVVVSEEYGSYAARFTAVHEIGHYLYHQRRYRRHWERTFDPCKPRTKEEREADRFAAMFLMPPKLLRRRIDESFGLPIVINDRSLFHFCPNATDLDSSSLDLEYAVAKSTRDFNNRSIIPLHQQFKVSVAAMAIQLKELRVLDYPATSYSTDL